ncbi:hypothetical protein RB653_004263 [Dictyostelium firmibasis]|uniref:Integrator complex subunit 5 C-terminal domain-containing protein n=1 Tax=Dictyostelium firmibasis TaxID=79012 RepID=A0AAN7UIZ7_9MYCE
MKEENSKIETSERDKEYNISGDDNDNIDNTLTISWIEDWRNEAENENEDINEKKENNDEISTSRYNLFLERILTLDSNSNLKNILNLNEYPKKENKSKETDTTSPKNATASTTAKTTTKKYVRTNNLLNNNGENITYITSPLSNESLESTEECCFFLVHLPITKQLIFNQFTCLLIHLFQIEYSNTIIINNATSTTTNSLNRSSYNNNYNNNYNYNNNNNNYNYNNNYNRGNNNNYYNHNNNNNNNNNNSNNNQNYQQNPSLKIRDLEGYQDCSHLKKLCLTIHDHLIQLLQRNPLVWYDSVVDWSLSTLTILTRLLITLKNNKLQQQLKNKQPTVTATTPISTMVRERLDFYSFRSLLSLFLHLTRVLPIETFIERSNVSQFLDISSTNKTTPPLSSSTTTYELGWILCHLGKKNPSLILELTFNHCLKNINSICNKDNKNNNNNNNVNSKSHHIQDINCFQILEFLASQPSSYLSIIFQQHIDRIINDHKSNNNKNSLFLNDIKSFLMLISKDDGFLSISLPIILDKLSPFGINQFDCDNGINSINDDNNNDKDDSGSNEKAIESITEILEKVLLGNSQVISFHSKRILLVLYYCCFGDGSESTSSSTQIKNQTRFNVSIRLLTSIVKDRLEKQLIGKLYSPTLIFNQQQQPQPQPQPQLQNIENNTFINNLNQDENILFYLSQIQCNNNNNNNNNNNIHNKLIKEKNNIILKLISLIGMDSVYSSLMILKHIISKFNSNQFIQYFYKLVEQFQASNSNTIEFFFNDIFKSIDAFTHDDLITLLNNLLELVKTSNLSTIYNEALKSISSNWVVLLKLIKHPNLIESNKMIAIEILYHSFNNRYNNNNSQSIQQLEINNHNIKKKEIPTLSDKEMLEIRVLLEKILNLIFKSFKEKDSFERLKKFEIYKNLYLLICNGSLVYFSSTIDLIFDSLFSTKTDMIIKLPILCALSPANTLPPPNYPTNLESSGSIIGGVSGSSYENGEYSDDGANRSEEEEIYFKQIINPSLPLSQPLIMLPMQPSLLEINYERKYYHYKFNDMNNPNHIPFTNKPKNLKKRSENNNDYIGKKLESSSLINNTNEITFKKQRMRMKKQQLDSKEEKLVNKETEDDDEDQDQNDEQVNYEKYNILNNEIDLQSFIKSLVLYDSSSNNGNNHGGDINDRLQILTNQFLLRVSSPYIEPSYDSYQEILPKQSHYERDIFIRNLFQQNPFLYRVLEIISIDGRELTKCLEIIKSLLVNEISYWYQCRNSYSESPIKSPHYHTTIQLVKALINAEFIIHPLNLSLELFDKIKADEISYILTSIWNFIKDYQPNPSQYQQQITSSTTNDVTTPTYKRVFNNCNTTPYSLTLKAIFHNHIKELCFHYARFFPKKYN